MESHSLFSSTAQPLSRIALYSGLAAFFVGAAHVVIFAASGGDLAWSGPIGLRKPSVFGFSIGLTLLSLGWMLRYFFPRPQLHTTLVSIMSGALLLEIAIISLQRFRGVPSHFNMSTVLDAVLWTAMGLAIVAFAVGAIIVAVLSFGLLRATPAMNTAIRAGMVALVFSQVSGQVIVLHGASVIFEEGRFVMENLARTTTIGAAGNLKLPHAIAMHGMQVLPLLALLIGSLRWSDRRSRNSVAVAGAGFVGLALVAQLQAYAGRAPFDLTPANAILLGLAVVAFVLPWIIAAGSWATRGLGVQRARVTAAA